MTAVDASGGRALGYRASGLITELEGETRVQFRVEPQVHDEKRPVWTTMNPDDRPDIRKQIIQLATKAVSRLKKQGEDTFEHRLP